MALTPLHFDHYDGEVWYGRSFYITDCGRFEIWKTEFDLNIQESDRVWKVDANELQDSPGYQAWSEWIEDTGLSDATFPTRGAVLNMLTDMLHAEGIYHEELPKISTK